MPVIIHSNSSFFLDIFSGDILMWDLSKTSKQKWQLFGNETGSRHTRIVFNICQYPAKDMIITVSMDRLVGTHAFYVIAF